MISKCNKEVHGEMIEKRSYYIILINEKIEVSS